MKTDSIAPSIKPSWTFPERADIANPPECCFRRIVSEGEKNGKKDKTRHRKPSWKSPRVRFELRQNCFSELEPGDTVACRACSPDIAPLIRATQQQNP
jgi:hypothetical protein